MPEIDHLSYSAITTFLTCPENYRRKYIAKEPTFSTPALVFGSCFHDTIEGHLSGKGELLNLWASNWEKYSRNDNILWGLESSESHFNEGVRLFSNKGIKDSIAAIELKSPEHVERKITLEVPGVPIPIIGYIDGILKDGTPCDFKTSKARWSDAKAADSLQSLFYLAGLNQAGDDSHNWNFCHLVFVKTKEPQFQKLQHSHKPAELFFLFEIIKRVWDAIEHNNFVINPTGWLCSRSYCDFYANCRGRYE